MTVTIIGAGLAGLAAAYRLQCAGIEAHVLEANTFAGGRIQPAVANGHQDLGPTWVWPYAQPTITAWLGELELALFDQFDSGIGLIDQSADAKAQKQNLPSQYGSARIVGGTHALITALLNKLKIEVRFGHVVNSCTRKADKWQLTITTQANMPDTAMLETDYLIIAIPPRLAAGLFTGQDTTLSDELKNTTSILDNTETWMAPHAKVVALYENAFWREQGLSGRVASQVGPLIEMHDHSGPDGSPAALFGFAGISADARLNNRQQFIAAIKHQLKRCFGDHAPEPLELLVKDWAFEPLTATDKDRNGDGAHPHVLPNAVRSAHCEHSLWFAVSETADRSPGLIEGALARADEVARAITSVAK